MVKTSRRYVSGEDAKRLKEVIESTHNKPSLKTYDVLLYVYDDDLRGHYTCWVNATNKQEVRDILINYFKNLKDKLYYIDFSIVPTRYCYLTYKHGLHDSDIVGQPPVRKCLP